MERLIIVFTSPKAGSGQSRHQIPRLLDLLAADGIRAVSIDQIDDLKRTVKHERETGGHPPIVVSAGGDGTLSLIASHTDSDTPLLPMPMGTENLLARHFGQTNDAESVMQTIRAGRQTRIDAGTANGRLFLIMATVGFDADVVRRLHLRRKGFIRRSSYLWPILQSMVRYRFPELKLTLLDHTGDPSPPVISAGWVMSFNLPCYAAGLNIAKNADETDGKLDVATFAGRGLISGLRYLAGIATGRHGSYRDVNLVQSTHLRIESNERVYFQLDGDYAGRLPLEIKLTPSRICLLIPEFARPAASAGQIDVTDRRK